MVRAGVKPTYRVRLCAWLLLRVAIRCWFEGRTEPGVALRPLAVLRHSGVARRVGSSPAHRGSQQPSAASSVGATSGRSRPAQSPRRSSPRTREERGSATTVGLALGGGGCSGDGRGGLPRLVLARRLVRRRERTALRHGLAPRGPRPGVARRYGLRAVV